MTERERRGSNYERGQMNSTQSIPFPPLVFPLYQSEGKIT